MNEILLAILGIGIGSSIFFIVFAAMLGWKGMFQFFFQPSKYFNETNKEDIK